MTTANPPANVASFTITQEIRDALDAYGQDENGDDVYSNDRAMFGYITANEYLVLPSFLASCKATSFNSARIPSFDIDDLSKKEAVKNVIGDSGESYRDKTAYLYYSDKFEALKIAAMNYVTLIRSGLDSTNACVAANLRSRWICLGAAHVTANNDDSVYDEFNDRAYANVKPDTILDAMDIATNENDLLNAMAGDADSFLKACSDDQTGVKFCIKIAECIWLAVEYMFRTRGHHWKDTYANIYEKFVTAFFENNLAIPANIAPHVLYRIAIHPFGVHALPVVAYHFAAFSKASASSLVRFNGAPNGNAVITTTAAAIHSIRGEVWYSKFMEINKESVEFLHAARDFIIENKYSVHTAHNLYGAKVVTGGTINGKVYTIDQMKDEVAMLAATAQGFIQAMKTANASGAVADFALKNAQALAKYSAQNPLQTAKVNALVAFTIEAINNSKNIEEATKLVIGGK